MGKWKKMKLSEVPQFAVGDYVFAKIKGYKHWPAEVKQIIKTNTYLVTFFGSEDNGTVHAKSMEIYNDENCARFNTERQMERADYKKAIDAVESLKKTNEQDLNEESSEDESESVEQEDEKSIDVKSVKLEGEVSTSEEKAAPKIELMRVQFLLLELTCDIQHFMKSIETVDQVLAKTKELEEVLKKATWFVLSKYPQIVLTQQKLCKFIEKILEWEMTFKDYLNFKPVADQIVDAASKNYKTMQDMFLIPSGSTFEETFRKKTKEIQHNREKCNLDFNSFFEILSASDLKNCRKIKFFVKFPNSIFKTP